MEDDEFLQLSGIRHFAYCRRQWALIHVEGQWEENTLTAKERPMLECAYDVPGREKRENILMIRQLPVFSRRLGVNGVCDAVEFLRSEEGVPIIGAEGKWLPRPVEYKRGSPKENPADRQLLCCQAICLEEMLRCPPIPKAYLCYGETSRRTEVELTPELRKQVEEMLREMHAYMKRGYTPKAKKNVKCTSCSLKKICLPELEGRSAKKYLLERLCEPE